MLSGLIFGIRAGTKELVMKSLAKKVIHFLKKEWFLLVTLGAIAVIVLLFEVL